MFTANSYIISANGSHKHPSPATIVAIAAAARDNPLPDQSRRTLYVTSGAAIQVEAITMLFKALCTSQQEIEALIGEQQGLEIRYLSNGSYMSIDGGTNQVPAPASRRDLLGNTTQWFFGDTTIDRSRLFLQLEFDGKELLERRSKEFVCFFVSSRLPPWRFFLNTTPYENPKANIASETEAFSVQEMWQPEANEISFRATSPQKKTYVLDHRPKEGGYTLRFKDKNDDFCEWYLEKLKKQRGKSNIGKLVKLDPDKLDTMTKQNPDKKYTPMIWFPIAAKTVWETLHPTNIVVPVPNHLSFRQSAVQSETVPDPKDGSVPLIMDRESLEKDASASAINLSNETVSKGVRISDDPLSTDIVSDGVVYADIVSNDAVSGNVVLADAKPDDVQILDNARVPDDDHQSSDKDLALDRAEAGSFAIETETTSFVPDAEVLPLEEGLGTQFTGEHELHEQLHQEETSFPTHPRSQRQTQTVLSNPNNNTGLVQQLGKPNKATLSKLISEHHTELGLKSDISSLG